MTKEQFIALGLTEDQATKAAEQSANELKTYIPKHRFDEVNDENKTLKGTVKDNELALETLKKSTGDAEELTKQIETLQNDNKTKDDQYKKDLNELKLNNAIKLAITGKAQDEDLVAGLFDKTKLILGDDGKITGLDEQLTALKENKKFLFKEDVPPETKPKVTTGTQTGQTQTGGTDEPLSFKDAVQSAIQAQLK